MRLGSAQTCARYARWVTVVLIGIVGSARIAWAKPTAYALDPTQSTLRIHGHATWHDFIGTTHTLQGRLLFDPDLNALIKPAWVTVPVASLTTGNARRDQAMRAMFETDRYPEIRFVLMHLTLISGQTAQTAAVRRYRMDGHVRVRAITRPITFEIEARFSADGIDVVGEAPLTTAMFELHPPSVAGLIRVHPDVQVRFISRWKPHP